MHGSHQSAHGSSQDLLQINTNVLIPGRSDMSEQENDQSEEINYQPNEKVLGNAGSRVKLLSMPNCGMIKQQYYEDLKCASSNRQLQLIYEPISNIIVNFASTTLQNLCTNGFISLLRPKYYGLEQQEKKCSNQEGEFDTKNCGKINWFSFPQREINNLIDRGNILKAKIFTI